MIVGQEKPSLDELAHHGIKGMHWGKRKTISTVPSTPEEIQAHRAKIARRVVTGIAVARVAQVYGPVLLKAAGVGVLTLANSNRTKAGESAILALSATASKIPYAKIAKGAYKITTM